MKIWVDADACPKAIKDILFRAAERTAIHLILVANAFLTIPGSRFIKTVRVDKGFDNADNYIVQHLEAGDLVITADIPLAAEVIARQALALNPRGELYTANDIKQRLGLRDMREQLRASGVNVGGPKVLGEKEKASFARALDTILAKAKRTSIY
ncbi:YaiI/YqxD family protein [Legionella fairfieldensis]|uniref:YaiI/YqxD family protein n=1 Tax=Legionella fairfieldensis TaxID=45064 RepID=UPI00048BA659|nr:YaiI/YqxD family protein [Legionella fairfieldensis]